MPVADRLRIVGERLAAEPAAAPSGWLRSATPYLLTSSWNACWRLHCGPVTPSGHGSSTGAAISCVWRRRQRRRRRADAQLGARAVRAGRGDQVVVHLHDDLRALVHQHAGALRERVRRVAGHPGGDPRRLAEPRRASRSPTGRAAGRARRSTSSPCRRSPAFSCVGRGRLRAGGLVEDHVVDDAGALGLDQRGRDERVLLELRIEHEAVVVVDRPVRRVRGVRLVRARARASCPGRSGRRRSTASSGGRPGCRPGRPLRPSGRGSRARRSSAGERRGRRSRPSRRPASRAASARPSSCRTIPAACAFASAAVVSAKRCDAAEAVAARALRVEDRRDVGVVGRAGGSGAAVSQQHGRCDCRQDREDDGAPHLRNCTRSLSAIRSGRTRIEQRRREREAGGGGRDRGLRERGGCRGRGDRGDDERVAERPAPATSPTATSTTATRAERAGGDRDDAGERVDDDPARAERSSSRTCRARASRQRCRPRGRCRRGRAGAAQRRPQSMSEPTPSSGAESRAPARYQTRNDRASQPWAAPQAIARRRPRTRARRRPTRSAASARAGRRAAARRAPRQTTEERPRP